jgi:hypothetical protein
MKKLFLFLALMIGMLTAHAADYSYLTFETTDGAKVSVEASSLNLTFSGTTLTAGSQSFTLINLSKMYFTTTDQTTTGIKAITAETLSEATEIYDLNGRQVSKGEMRKGIYIVKTKTGAHKMIVK